MGDHNIEAPTRTRLRVPVGGRTHHLHALKALDHFHHMYAMYLRLKEHEAEHGHLGVHVHAYRVVKRHIANVLHIEVELL